MGQNVGEHTEQFGQLLVQRRTMVGKVLVFAHDDGRGRVSPATERASEAFLRIPL